MKDPWATLGKGLLIMIDERQRRKYLVREWIQKNEVRIWTRFADYAFSADNLYTPRTSILSMNRVPTSYKFPGIST